MDPAGILHVVREILPDCAVPISLPEAIDGYPMGAKKIAIVMYQYPLGVSTMILNSIVELTQRGDSVVLFIDDYTYQTARFDYEHPLFSLQLFETPSSLVHRGWRRIKRSLNGLVFGGIYGDIHGFSRAYDPEMGKYYSFLQSKIDGSFTHLIGVEALGISLTSGLSANKKVIYYNMELLQGKACRDYRWKSIKSMELQSLKEVTAVVIQNNERAKVFCAVNNFDRNRVELLPIFPIGECIAQRTDSFRRMFDISEDKSIVVYAGNFQPWAFCHEIIESVREWDTDFVLIMHTWNKGCLCSTYFRKMVEMSKGLPIFFSTEPVAYAELPSLLASAHIGLLFYEPIDENFTEILGSSNKLAEYLKACLPVVTLSGGSLADFVMSKGIGLAVDRFSDLPAALRKIRLEHHSYRQACGECYGNEMGFGTHFDRLYARAF